MTVQAGIETVTDLEVLVGEMPSVPCESPSHNRRPKAHQGRATHYAVSTHECFGPVGEVMSICARYAKHCAETLWEEGVCVWCGTELDPGEGVQVVAPITSSTR